MADYGAQINVKIGDHLVNLQGDTVEDAVSKLLTLAENAAVVHEALEKLDLRPATEIAQKEWGSRSQRRAPAPAPRQQPTPQQYMQATTGATVVGVEPNQPQQPVANGAPAGAPVMCPIHNAPRTYYGPGVSKTTQKPYGASMRCQVRGCKPAWQSADGTWA